jgi:hypothetical protein
VIVLPQLVGVPVDKNHPSNKLSFILIIALGVTALAVIGLFNRFLPVDSAALSAAGGGAYFTLVHGVTNAYHLWRFDPVIGFIYNLYGYQFAILSLLLIAALGVTLLLWSLKLKLLDAFCFAVVLVMALGPVSVGFDSVIIGSLAWLPWCVGIILIGFDQGFRRVHYLALFLISVLLSFSSNQLAPVFMLFNSFYVWERSRYLHPRLKYELIAILLIPAIVLSFLIPGPFFERYQPFSHFVPAYNTEQGRYGLVGPEIQFPVIDLAAVRSALNYPWIYLGALLIALVTARLLGSDRSKIVTGGSIALIAALAWFAMTSPHTSQISPIAAINRMLPGLSLLTLAPVVFVLTGAIILILFATAISQPKRIFCTLIGSILALWGAGAAPVVWDIDKFRTIFDVADSNGQVTSIDDFKVKFSESSEENKNAVISPGLYLIRNYGLGSWQNYIEDKDLIYRDIEELSPSLEVANGTPDILNLVDLNLNTRARIGRSPQTGNDWIMVRLKDPASISGLWLRNDGFTSDYPRAFQIGVVEDCSLENIKATDDFSMFKIVSSYSPWEGQIKLTKAGVPYFGPITDIKVTFAPQENIRCIIIKQPVAEAFYDWSATGLQLAFAKDPQNP